MANDERPSWNKYYLGIALAAAQRATCIRRHFGAIIVKDHKIVSTGYCGAPPDTPNCCDYQKCYRQEKSIPAGQRYDLCRSTHAEENAMLRASWENMQGATMYIMGVDMTKPDRPVVAAHPCMQCQKHIMSAGLEKIVTMDPTGTILEFSVTKWKEEQRKNPFHHLDNPYYSAKPAEQK